MTDKAPASKSEAKRVAAQKAPKIVKTVDHTETVNQLLDRVSTLEARVKVLCDAVPFIADESRPIYGLGAIALIFDAIAKKLK